MAADGRFFYNNLTKLPSLNYCHELIQSLERINTYNPPVHTCSTGWSFDGFYRGPTSVAFLFYRLSLLYPDLEFRQQTLLEWADEYLKLSQHARHDPPDPNHCGITSETLAFYALTSIVNNDQSLVTQICSYEAGINSDVGSNELLYGRAGYLYILRLCRTHFEAQPGTQKLAMLLDNTIQRTVEHILSIPRPWIWYGTEYLGAGHGYIGIVTQVLLSSPPDQVAQIVQRLEEIVIHLLDMQLESGNFASSIERLGTSKDDRLVQMCHGSPGFLLSFRSIGHFFSAELRARIARAVQRAEDDVWRRGLLTKVPCLCHGIAGNALVFTNADDMRFEAFLSQMTTQELDNHNLAKSPSHMGKPWLYDAGRKDDFVGLFTGEAGRAWVWAVADKKLDRTCLGYNDI